MTVKILQGDCRDVLKTLPDESVHCVVTSPPYWGLRDYGVAGQLGLESTPAEYVEKMVAVFREVRRVLRDDGTLWLNLGDSYASTPTGGQSSKPSKMTGGRDNQIAGSSRPDKSSFGLAAKQLIGIPWRVAFALQADGWYLRQDIIWAKPNPMPESVRDRCTKAHEYIFLLAKSERYYFDAKAIAEPFADERMGNPGAYRWSYASDPETGTGIRGEGGPSTKMQAEGWNADGERTSRNKRSVWTVTTKPYTEAHFATFPPELIEPCILAGCPEGGTVLDPFGGAGTTGLVADRHKRNAILIELNQEYAEMARRRITNDAPLFAEVS